MEELTPGPTKNSELLTLIRNLQNEENFSESEIFIFLAEEMNEAITAANIGQVFGRSACITSAQKIAIEALKTYDLDDEPEDVYAKIITDLRRGLCYQRIRILNKEQREKENPVDEAFIQITEAEKLRASITRMQQNLEQRENNARSLLTKVMKATLLNLHEMTAHRRTVKSYFWADICDVYPVSKVYIMPFEVYSDTLFKLSLKEDWE